MSFVRSVVRAEIANIVTSILIAVLMFVGFQYVVKSVEAYVVNIDNKINGLDYAIFNVQRYLTSRDNCSDTSSESSDESSEDSESVPSMVSRDPYPNPEWVDRFPDGITV